MTVVLTVCIGNICRSPMAAGLFQSRLENGKVFSAGTAALVGHSADPLAQQLMLSRGIDISSHRAQQINLGLCQQAELILVMDTFQKKLIEQRYPSARGKIFRIAESLKQDVPDPYQKPQFAFEYALELIENGAMAWVERINKINSFESK